MKFDLSELPLLDHHCHTIVNVEGSLEAEVLIRSTSEALETYPLEDLIETNAYGAAVHYIENETQRKINNIAELSHALKGINYIDYCRKIFQTNRYEKLFIDVGYSPESEFELSEMAEVTETEIYPIIRLETLAEELMDPEKSFSSWWEEFIEQVKSARNNGYIGAKSIAAYRTGLNIKPIDRSKAEESYKRWTQSGKQRLHEKDLVNFIVWETTPLIINQSLPFQFHTGYGNPRSNLFLGNPLLMRSFIEEFTPKGLNVVLLHTYPYHREAGFLASVYEGVFFDVSLIIPLGVTGSRQVLMEALDLTPMSRFLFASDGHTRPELYGLAAELYRDALETYFMDPSNSRFISVSKALRWCENILSNNSKKLYLG